MKLLVVHAAVRALPAPLKATGALQSAIVNPPSRNCTVPVGLSPVTVAVRVTLLPAVEGLAELSSDVVVAPGAGGGEITTAVNVPFRASAKSPLLPVIVKP